MYHSKWSYSTGFQYSIRISNIHQCLLFSRRINAYIEKICELNSNRELDYVPYFFSLNDSIINSTNLFVLGF